jgi:serine/threonine protein kinase/tetratricopeptide (TPR) repeat protein
MPADLKRVKDLFLAAFEKPDPVARQAFLQEACGADDELRRQVEALLRQHDQASGFLESPPTGLPEISSAAAESASGARRSPDAPDKNLGSRIGPYKLLQVLGEGGMGTVYLAEQQEPVRRWVALKISKAGMDSARVIARFEAERQALALMDHPHIAKVLDAGATEIGCPYFVMELVKGIPITMYCDQEHLTPLERLELFIPVCQAVQHAHQKGVIHRDLKPSNVLVAPYDGRPVPKVIDFGVAKATAQRLTERTMFTEVGQIIGTLEYMAPEQAELNNLDIDTRADIYSLGVILYELLTGGPPFTAKQLRSAAFDEMLRMLREVEPPRPSTKLSSSDELPAIAAKRRLEPKKLTKLVHGELDWIVMKCLAKERSRRYETANGLVMDLQRYLADEPVQAGPPSAGYRLRKLAHKYRTPLRVAAVFMGLLVIAAAVSTWQAIRARQAERTAEQKRQEADRNFTLARRAVENYLAKVTENRRLTEVDLHGLRKELLEAALPFYEQFVQQSENDPALRAEQGRAYERLGKVRHLLGEVGKALAHFQEMKAIFEELTKLYPEVADYRQGLGQAHNNLGEALQKLGRLGEAEQQHAQALAVQHGLADLYPDVAEYRRDVGFSHFSRALVLAELGRREEMIAEYRESLILHEQLARDFPANPDYRRRLAWSHNNLGNNLCEMGRYAEGESEIRKALVIKDQLVRDFPGDPEYRVSVANSHIALGNLFHRRQRPEASEPEQRQAATILEEVARQFPSVPDYRFRLAQCQDNLGNVLRDLNRRAEAVEQYRQAMRLYERLRAEHPDIAEHSWGVANTRALLAWVLADQGDHRQAAAELWRINEREAGSGEARYNTACGWSLTMAAVLRDSQLSSSERKKLAEEYASLSLHWLKKAGDAGYFRDGGNADWLRHDTNLVPDLRSRPDFAKLLKELGA